MTRYETDQVFERNGYTVEVKFAPCDTHPADLYDDSCFDIDMICSDIDRGVYEWLSCLVVVSLEGVELGTSSLGGLLYKDYREMYTDGVVDDIIDDAMNEAVQAAGAIVKAVRAREAV